MFGALSVHHSQRMYTKAQPPAATPDKFSTALGIAQRMLVRNLVLVRRDEYTDARKDVYISTVSSLTIHHITSRRWLYQQTCFQPHLPLTFDISIFGTTAIVNDELHDHMFPTVACFIIRAQATPVTVCCHGLASRQFKYWQRLHKTHVASQLFSHFGQNAISNLA